VPAPLWRVNLRHRLSQSEWKKLRASVIAARGPRCETCGAAPAKLSAHEDWAYDTSVAPAVAKLVDVRLSCWLCHAVEHIGFTYELAHNGVPHALDAAIAHFCRRNRVGRAEFEAHKDEAFVEWRRRNTLAWQVDWGRFAQR
jgi:hypothetical protein